MNLLWSFRYVGFYGFRSPILIVKDLDLIKRIGVKDFEHFVDHRVFMDEDADPLFGKNLFFLRGIPTINLSKLMLNNKNSIY